mmetsp:Transcript_10452/g.22133  ORF Transcript_10452/g.22133 Transcript_10452/m.22133 type:complete len:601 (-) Transcript_10452:315-2117(-)
MEPVQIGPLVGKEHLRFDLLEGGRCNHGLGVGVIPAAKGKYPSAAAIVIITVLVFVIVDSIQERILGCFGSEIKSHFDVVLGGLVFGDALGGCHANVGPSYGRLGPVVVLVPKGQQVVINGIGTGCRAFSRFHEDPFPLAGNNRFSKGDVVDPVGNAPDVLREQHRRSVAILGILVALIDQTGVLQVGDPLRRRHVPTLQLELDLEDSVGEPGYLVGLEYPFGVPEPGAHPVEVVAALGNHAQVRVQGDPDGRVKGNLEGRSHALGTNGRNELLADADLGDFLDQRFPLVAFLFGLALGEHGLSLFFDRVGVGQDLVDFRFVDRESLLHGNLSRPLVVVSLSLDKNQIGIPVSVPSQAEGDRPRTLLEPSVVQLELVVVEVDRVGKLRIALPRRRLLQKDRQVSQYVVLDSRDVFRLDPVLGRLAEEGLLVVVLVRNEVVSQARIDVAQPDDEIGIVPPDPRLGVHPRNVKGLAGDVWEVLVVFFEDLVASHKVDVDVLFEAQKVARDLVGLVHVDVVDGGFLLDGLDLFPELAHLFQGELFDLGQLKIHRAEKFFSGDGFVAHCQTTGVGLRGDRHGDLSVLQIGATRSRRRQLLNDSI